MKTHAIIQDYYGATNYIELNKDRDLTIFIVDDNRVYLKLLKQSLKRKNFTILTFATGEECLNYLELKPNLVILDYHLDGVNPYAQKGDKIAELINEQLPETETILISSDEKFHFISNINFSKKVLFKDVTALSRLKKSVKFLRQRIKRRRTIKSQSKVYTYILGVLIVMLAFLIYIIFS